MTPQEHRRRLWFADGFWWSSSPVGGTDCEISSLMREQCFRPDLLAAALGMGTRSFHRMVKEALDLSPGIWLRWERGLRKIPPEERSLRQGTRL